MSDKLYNIMQRSTLWAMGSYKNLDIMGLSKKEQKVLLAVIRGIPTPLLISHETRVTRPAVYDILLKLKKRGLVKSHIIDGKKSWDVARAEDIDRALYEAKKVVLSLSEGVEEVKGLSDGTVIVHKGVDAVRTLIVSIAKDHKEERLYTLQGDRMQVGWDAYIGKDRINEFNENVKRNGILTETIIPYGWFDDHMKTLQLRDAVTWAQGFTNRAMGTYQIDKKYFNNAAQIFILKSSLYLISMNEALIIEIRHSELQSMIKHLFLFIKDHSEKIDINSILQRKIHELEFME